MLFLLAAALGAPRQASETPNAGWRMSTWRDGDQHARWTGSAAFFVPAGEGIDPALEPGDERVSFRANVRIAKAGKYRFGIEVEGGTATLSVHGAGGSSAPTVFEWTFEPGDTIAKCQPTGFARGEILVIVGFTRSGTKAARLRTLWQREPDADGHAFGPEPISSFFARVPDGERYELRAPELAFEGRLLLQRKGCVQCHEAPRGAFMIPALEAPILDRLGLRADRDWVERWIRDPAKLKPSADMPSLYAAGAGDSSAVANWLTREQPRSEHAGLASEAFVLERGRMLYHTIGCVACHGAYDKPSELFGEEHADDDESMPANNFGDLAGKWRPAALSEFLREPLEQRPDGRMPDLGLSRDEADSLSNYLLSKWGPAPMPTAALQAGEVATLKTCAACHAIEGVERAATLGMPLERLDLAKGCLDPEDRATPRYDLSAREIEALRAGIAEAKLARGKPAPFERARARMEFHNCGACHARDGRGGAADGVRAYFTTQGEKADLGNEGRIPPDLSGVGFKLSTPWLDEVLAAGARARPYLATRMPSFGKAATHGLAADLARSDGVEPHADSPEPIATAEAVQNGRALMGKSALACATCHPFKDFGSQGTPGPRVDMFAERLRYEWWTAYMQDPQRYKPGTKMPSFESGGRSTCRTILGGDLKQQLDALWSYQNLGEFMPAPEGVERGRGLQLIVGARPIVLRTFLESVGPRAIAVGMPSAVHFAFDAGKVRLAEAWRGDFLDASAAWTGRGGENTGGEGPTVWKAPEGAVFCIPRDDAPIERWPVEVGADAGFQFRGYSIGGDGLPTFEYRWREWELSERVTTDSAPKPRILREFTLSSAPPVFVVNSGPGENRLYLLAVGEVRISSLEQGIRRFEVRLLEPDKGCKFTLEINP